MNAEAVCFDRVRGEYELCSDFREIVVVLKEGVIPEIDGSLLEDGYLFRFRRLCIPRTFLRDYFV